MTDINHRRKNKKPINKRNISNNQKNEFNNGWGQFTDSDGSTILPLGNTQYLNKGNTVWSNKSLLADRVFVARTPNDCNNGHKGMSKEVKGAKKFIRTRTRFHENAQTQKLAKSFGEEE